MERLATSQSEVDKAFKAIVSSTLKDVAEAYRAERATTPEDVIPAPENKESEKSVAEQELFAVARAERDSSPTESDPAGHISETAYNQRLNYRLSVSGFMLDAARSHIDSDAAAEVWLELKKAIAEAKGRTDIYSKVDAVIKLEAAVYDFAIAQGATQADYNEAVGG